MTVSNSGEPLVLDRAHEIEIGQQAAAYLARQKYGHYLEYVYGDMFEHARHIDKIAATMDRVIAGELKRVMLCLPPRGGKSMTVTKAFPSYYLGKFPDKRVISVSYSDVLADEFGEANRRKVFECGKRLFGVSLSRTKATRTDWNLFDHNGGMLSTSVGGGVTGKGADLLIIDDPIRNRQDAESETYRRRLIDEYQSTLYTRLHAGGVIIVILTRWHEADLAAKLLAPNNGAPEDWHVLSIPAVCDSENDAIGRDIGEAYWPEHGFDTAWAERTRKTVGEYAWASLYQQRPTPAGGAIFRREWMENTYRALPDHATMIQSWDLPFVKSEASAKCAGLVLARSGANYYLVDVFNEKVDFVENIAAMRTVTAKHPDARAKVIEDKANGPAIISMLHKEIPGLVPFSPHGSKEDRARSVTPVFESGNFFYPVDARGVLLPFVHDFIEDLVGFPNREFRDTVDALSQGILYLEKALGESGGLVYRKFVTGAEAYTCDDIMAVPFVAGRRFASINVGVSLGGAKAGTAFVATAVEEDFKAVAVVDVYRAYADMAADDVAEKLIAFVAGIESKVGPISFVHCGGENNAERVLFKTMTARMTESGKDARIRWEIGHDERDRIDMTNNLLENNALFIGRDMTILKASMMEALWDPKKNRNARVLNGAADIQLLEAMERSYERYMKRFINAWGGRAWR